MREDSALYEEQLRQVEQTISGAQNEQISKEMEKLEEEEKLMDQQLAELELEEQKVEKEEQELDHQLLLQKNEKQQFWKQFNQYERDLVKFQEDLGQTQSSIKNIGVQYEFLKNCNSLHQMFPIATADDFGTICGFRLGRLSTNDVKWEEINMALG